MTQQDNEQRRPILRLKKRRDSQRQQLEEADAHAKEAEADLMIEANLGDEADIENSSKNGIAERSGKATPLQIGKRG